MLVHSLDESCNLSFEIAGQKVTFQQDAVLEGLMPALDFPAVLLTRKNDQGTSS
jgi:hypothetical protein